MITHRNKALILLFVLVMQSAIAADNWQQFQHILQTTTVTNHSDTARYLNALILSLKTFDEKDRVSQTNRFFNQFEYQTDLVTYSKIDYWAGPLELIAKGAGDCEDMAIAKYVTLTKTGISDSQLYLTYVNKLDETQQAHMVLLYYPAKEIDNPWVLDSATNDIRRLQDRHDLIPVYSFNHRGILLPNKN